MSNEFLPKERFGIDRYITSSGVVDLYDIEDNDLIRLVIEGSSATTTIEVSVRLKGQSSWTSLGSLSNNSTLLVRVDTYDQMKLDCTSFGGTIFHLLASGYRDGE